MSSFEGVGDVIRSIKKTPDAQLPYDENWGSWLKAGDSIASVVWSSDTGITLYGQSHTATIAQTWISGGTVGTTYRCKAVITTTNGLTDARVFDVRVMVRGD